jgi:hypothetical protein
MQTMTERHLAEAREALRRRFKRQQRFMVGCQASQLLFVRVDCIAASNSWRKMNGSRRVGPVDILGTKPDDPKSARVEMNIQTHNVRLPEESSE